MSLPVRIFWLLWCLAYMAIGAAVPLAWDAVPDATSYRIFRGIDVVATSFSNKATVELPGDQTSVLTVTAVNLAGESDHSAPLTIFIPRTRVTVQFSKDLAAWSDLPFPDAQFYRAKIETP